MSDVSTPDPAARTKQAGPETWAVKQPFGWRTLLIGLLVLVFMTDSARRLELGDFAEQVSHLAEAALGLRETSQIGDAVSRIGSDMFPLAFEERTPVTRIEGFDADRLPPFSRLEEVEAAERRMNPDTLQLETVVHRETVLVEPAGYLVFVLGKMLETIEIALWATMAAVLLSVPLAYASARNFAPNILVYGAARGGVGFLRSMPELVTALFLVLAFGFGPLAGILALALHGAGFLGKFYADDVEAADAGPQDALRAIGAGPVKVLRIAVLPQILPGLTAQTLYLLDRNVRMAAVVGLVGGGGIGQELKGRYDLFEYDKVGTILLVLFVTVILLDQTAARIRRRLI